MVTIVRNGISLSAHAGLNGAPLRVLFPAPARIVRQSGDFADSPRGRSRREERRAKARARIFAMMG